MTRNPVFVADCWSGSYCSNCEQDTSLCECCQWCYEPMDRDCSCWFCEWCAENSDANECTCPRCTICGNAYSPDWHCEECFDYIIKDDNLERLDIFWRLASCTQRHRGNVMEEAWEHEDGDLVPAQCW
jgi:hypothetical protein